MKIVQLTAENVKRLKAVQITPDGKGGLVVVGGKNGAGKTSVLDSIEMAFAGAKSIPEMPLRSGSKKGHVVVQLDEEGMKVERSFTPKGSTVKVTSAKGVPFKSPQAMLDKLVGKISFDPLDFMRKKPAEQFELLKQLLKLDTSDLDAIREEAYGKRTEVGREVKALRSRVAAVEVPKDAPDEEVSAAEISEDLQKAMDANKKIADARYAQQHDEATASDLRNTITELEDQLADAKTRLENMAAMIKSRGSMLEKSVEIDTEPLKARMRDAESANAAARAKKEKAALEAALIDKETEHDDLDGLISETDLAKRERIAASKSPVPGLSLAEGAVTLNDVPLEQASSAEQLKISVAIGLAANPTLKVLLIRDGSLLDADNLKVIAEMAAEQDAQVWVERVGDGKECQVVLEDGSVKE